MHSRPREKDLGDENDECVDGILKFKDFSAHMDEENTPKAGDDGIKKHGVSDFFPPSKFEGEMRRSGRDGAEIASLRMANIMES